MDLREIEEKADEYLAEVLATDSDAAAGSWLYRLMALEQVAKIKQVADQRAQWNAHVAMRNEETGLRRREMAANTPTYAERAADPNTVRMPDGSLVHKHVWAPGCCTTSSEYQVHFPEPTKPATTDQCPATLFDHGWTYRCNSQSGHYPAGAHDWVGRPPAPDEPTKPAVDRLHDLVSYLVTESDRAHDLAGQNEISGADITAGNLEHRSKAYDDAATKLDEILREGSL